MYKWLATHTAKLGAPHARKLAEHAIRLGAMISASTPPHSLRRNVMGLSFPSPIGLAAGFDKQGTLYQSLYPLGFGFAEIGSVIPQPEQQRSPGMDAVAFALAQHIRPHAIPLGVSISMNRMTPPQRMHHDYLIGMEKLWPFADYITVNLGVRAGPDLHLPEHRATLYTVLTAIKNKQVGMMSESGRTCPIVVKIDQDRGDTNNLLACVRDYAFDGLMLSGGTHRNEEHLTLVNLQRVSSSLNGCIPIISVGGIRTTQDAADRLSAGASLLQIYSGLVEFGPRLPQLMNLHLSRLDAQTNLR